MKRRQFLATSGTALGTTALAGCLFGGDQPETGGSSGDLSGTLTIATYDSFVDAPSSSPGPWLKEEFESRYEDVTIEWKAPESGLNYYIERASQNASIDADLFIGLNTDDLVRVDGAMDDPLFDSLDTGSLGNYEHVKDDLKFDPDNRAIPYDTGIISLVYDENEVDGPTSFDDLLNPEYEGTLLAQNAQTSDPGQAFLLWTIANRGEDNYLDYWTQLVKNDVSILGSWWDAYSAYLNEEAPMVVSYSTDQVYAVQDDQDLSRHQVGFLDDQGYANPEGVARFADTDKPELATAFVEFMLEQEAQGEIATRNVQFPATDWAQPDSEFADYAYTPKETVTHSYDELAGSLNQWVDDWAQQIAEK